MYDGLSNGFDRCCDRRQRELTNNENIKGKYHVRIFLKDIFGFAGHQLKSTYGFIHRLALTRNSDNAVLNKDKATNIGKIKINAYECYVPHFTSSLEQYNIIMIQIIKKMATELQYPERSIFMKQVNTQNLWSYELSPHEGNNVPISI